MAIQPTPELIRAIQDYQKGCPQAFEVLYRSSLPYLTKCILNVINRTTSGADETLLQDILQDTYLTIAQKLDTLQKVEAFYQWAGQIATNHALRTWKKAIQLQEVEQAEDELLYELTDERFIPEDILEDREKQQLIRNMLQELPTGQYLCLVEYFYNGLKEKEIAEKLQMPLGTVKTNLSRAKKKLKDIVQTNEKKHGVKLYSMSWLLWLLLREELNALVINEKTASATYGMVSAELSANAAAAAGTAGSVFTGISAKIVSCVVAATLMVGGAAMVLHNARGNAQAEVTYPSETETVQSSAQETTLPVQETVSQPQQKVTGDVVLTAQDLAYMNQVASCVQLGAVPDGYVPYQKESYMYSINGFIAGCAGTEGLLKGKPVGDGLEVSKADLERFLLDTLGWVQDVDLTPYGCPIITQSGDTYLIERSYGDEAAPLAIHNLWAVNQDNVQLLIDTGFTFYRCTFERSADSQYGWILTEVKHAEQDRLESCVMSMGIYNSGIVLPENGEDALTWQAVGGEITMEAAAAYLRQYVLATTGTYPERVTAEESGLAGNAYFTYKICIKDSLGATQQCYMVGASDCAIFRYDEVTYEMEEIFWSLGDEA